MEFKYCFDGQSEYNEFLAWAIEGSCLSQRMQTSSGGTFDIPDYWFYWKKKKNLNADTELTPISREVPYKLDRNQLGRMPKGYE